MHESTFVADLALVLGVAAATSVLARLARQPTILGYLLAGVIVGPYIPLPVFADPDRVRALADFGVILVMFAVGLDFRIAKLLQVAPVSGLTALVEISFLIWCGYSIGSLLGWTNVESIFLGACLGISSTMVVSRVYDDKPVGIDVRRYVLGILVLQDVVAILLIAAMTGFAVSGTVSSQEVAGTLGRLAVVLLVMLVSGLLVIPRLVRAVVRLASPELLAVFSIGTCFVVAQLAESLGYSLALGAFLAGILVAESGKARPIEARIGSVRDMFAAVFFVSVGMTVDPSQAVRHLPAALLVSAVVVAAQFASVSVMGVISGNGLRRSIFAGLSLGQIGEFAFIISAIGVGAGVVGSGLQSVVVTVALLTTFTTPLFVGAADRIVGWVDRALPRRVRHLVALHEEWVERLRSRQAPEESGRPARRVLRALVFDATALIGVAAVSGAYLPGVSRWIGDRLGILLDLSGLELVAVALAASLPLLVGLVRNALALSRIVSRTILPSEGEPSGAARVAAQTLRLIVHLLIVVGVGVPAVAVLSPLVGGHDGWLLLGMVVVVVVIGLYLWRRAGVVESEFESSVEHIASILARQSAAAPEKTLSNPSLLPGLDTVVRLPLSARDGAVDRTLTDLDLRARSGATVVAIHRDRNDLLLPTGRERLQAGDVLALIGTKESLEKARAILVQGPETVGRREP